jgi:mannose-1-phosphate guanylyltransferase
MKVILLAAGLGTRLRPLTDNTPKCLVPINGKPLLEYWLDMLTKAGVKDILVNLHYLPEKVREYINRSQYKDLVKTVYEEVLLGTGGTLVNNKSFICKDEIMLVHADNLSLFDVKEFITAHENRPIDTKITMMSFITDAPETCGILKLDEKGRVLEFFEKVKNPPGNIANGAVYILENSVMDYLISFNKEIIDFSTEVIPSYIGKIYTYLNAVYHRDIGNMQSYTLAEQEFPAIYKKFINGN